MRDTVTVSDLEAAFYEEAKRQGRCDGRWGARANPGDFEGRARAAYFAEHAEGVKDREREPWRWGAKR